MVRMVRWNVQYQQELKDAEIAWQVWAKKLDELQQEQQDEDHNMFFSRKDFKILIHKTENRIYLASLNQYVYLSDLAKKHGWTRK